MLKKKYMSLSILIALFLILLLFFFRIRSYFRAPLIIFFPFPFYVLLYLIFMNVVLICTLILFFRNKPNNFMQELALRAIIPFKELHKFLSLKVNIYGVFYNKLNLFIQYCQLSNYSSVVIVIFVVLPYVVVLLTLIVECIILHQIFFTFKLLWLLLLPLLGKVLLISTKDFIEIQIEHLKNSLKIVQITENNNEFLDNTIFPELEQLNQKLFLVQKTENVPEHLKKLSKRQIYTYSVYFYQHQQNIDLLLNSFSKYSKYGSIIRSIVLIFLITYFIILNIYL